MIITNANGEVCQPENDDSDDGLNVYDLDDDTYWVPLHWFGPR